MVQTIDFVGAVFTVGYEFVGDGFDFVRDTGSLDYLVSVKSGNQRAVGGGLEGSRGEF